MLDVWCDGCNARVLLWPSNIDGITYTARGAEVEFHCHCGHDGTELIERSDPAQV